MNQQNQNQLHQRQKSTCQTDITPFENPSISSSYISYAHNQNNNIQTQHKNQQQYNTNNQGKLRLESLAKQYELKLSKQKQFYDLRQYRLKQQIHQLQSKLKYHQNTNSQQILVESSVSRHCQLCSNGQVIQHLKKMLKQVQQTHQGCLSNKRQLISQYELYRTRCGNYEFENERLKKQNDQLKHVNSKINNKSQNIQTKQQKFERVQQKYHNQKKYSHNQQKQQIKQNMSPIKQIQEDQFQSINKTYNIEQQQRKNIQGNKYQSISYDQDNIERRVVYISLEDQKSGKYDQIMNQFQGRQKDKHQNSNIQSCSTSNIKRQVKYTPEQEKRQEYRQRQKVSNNASLNNKKIQYQTRQAPNYIQEQSLKNYQRNNQSIMNQDFMNPNYLNRQTNYEPIENPSYNNPSYLNRQTNYQSIENPSYLNRQINYQPYPSQYRSRQNSKQNTRRQSFSVHKQNQQITNNPPKYNNSKYEQLLAQKKSLSINLLNNNITHPQVRKRSFYERQPLQDYTSTMNNTLGYNRFNFHEKQQNYYPNDTFREKSLSNPYKNSSQFENFAYRY